MGSLSDWLAGTNKTAGQRTLREQRHAAAAWKIINDKPSSIAFKTASGTLLAVQTVRIDLDSDASDTESVAGTAPTRKATVLGIKGHATLADTNIKEGYRFVLSGDEYRCVHVNQQQIGQVEADFEAVG